jgi:hypothetical protein
MKVESLTRDDRGAIMLIAVFFAIFAVSLLYYLIGISSSVLYREKLQDAADSAALSAAIMHARAMNLIVLINIIMAALLSVLVTLKMVETLAIIGTVLAAALAWFTAGASLSAIPPLNTVRTSMNEAYSSLQPPILRALKFLHDTADAVQEVTPGVALALVEVDLEVRDNPPGTHGVTFPTELELPVEDDSFSELCGRAGEFPFQLARDTLQPLPGVSEILDGLTGPMHDLTSSLSNWFCSDGSNAPPPYQQPVKRSYPGTGLTNDCENAPSHGSMSDVQIATSPACDESKADEAAAAADNNTGSCQAGHDCSLHGPYDTHVTLAREQCDPLRAPAPFMYYYQVRQGQVTYRWTHQTWVREVPIYRTPEKRSSNRPPCGPADISPSVAAGYNKTVRKHDDINEVLPVCSSEHEPSSLAWGSPGTTEIVEFTEVTQILGCERNETKAIDLSDAPRAGDVGNDKSPKRVKESSTLGDESFQLRAIMRGSVPTGLPETMIRRSLWNADEPANPLSALRELGNYSIAQAEYFYDGPKNPRSDWMWAMNWRARLRRFRVPTGDASSAIDTACGQLSGGCGPLLDQVRRLRDLIAH